MTHLKLQRMSLGLTQMQLAAKMIPVISPTLICKWENGKEKIPERAAKQLSKILKIPQGLLLQPVELKTTALRRRARRSKR